MAGIDHIAANQLPNTLGDAPVTTGDEFARAAANVDAPLQFATSRSGVATPVTRPEHITGICRDCLGLAGFSADDVNLNLFAPPPHMSGWAARRGFSAIGGRSLNRNFTDWEDAIGEADRATAMSSIPGKALALADVIAEQHGEPATVFPNLEMGAFSGSPLYPSQRDSLKDRYGLASTREFYGSSEAALVAAATDESRELVPLLNRFVLEIEVDGRPVDVREVETPTEGSILITDPARTAVPLRRYRQGDLVRVIPADPLPRIVPLGRADNAINVEGAIVHPDDLWGAIDVVFPEATGIIVRVDDSRRPPSIAVHHDGRADDRAGALYDALCTRQPALEHALAGGPDDQLTVTAVESTADLPIPPGADLKPRQIVFEADGE